MPATRHPFTASRCLQRMLAGWLAGVVLALGLLTVSPAAHARLHRHQAASPEAGDHSPLHTAHDDLGCAITLFQQGVTTPLSLPVLNQPPATWTATLPVAPVCALRSAPRHLLKPARGPPCRA